MRKIVDIHRIARDRTSWRDESGQGFTEYAIILSLVALTTMLISFALGPQIQNVFSRFVRDAPVSPPSLVGYTPPPTFTPTGPTNTPDPNATAAATATDFPTVTNTPPIGATATGTITPSPTNTIVASATPEFANCEFQEVGGVVVIEAENYWVQTQNSGTHSWIAHTAFGGYSGTGTMYTSPNNGQNNGTNAAGPKLNYRVRIETAGDYYIYGRGRAQDGGGDDSFLAGLNDTLVTNSDYGITNFDTSGYKWQRWGTAVSLQPGNYTINIWMREDGFSLDRIALINNTSLISNGSTSVGPSQSNAPAGCTNNAAPTATHTAVPTNTPTQTNTPPPTNTPTQTPTQTQTPTPPANDILFVVGNTSLNSGDSAVKSQLESSGFTVTVVDDSDSETSDATGKTLVIISSTVSSGNVNTKFRAVTVPVMTWETALQDDMELATTGTGDNGNEKDIVIQNSGHPLAAGLSGEVRIFSGNQTLPYGLSNSNAIVIATSDDDSDEHAIYAYETGAEMYDSFNAPARRLFFMLDNDSANDMNSDGWALFDAAINWLTP